MAKKSMPRFPCGSTKKLFIWVKPKTKNQKPKTDNPKAEIEFIITGGTIDSFYDAPKDTVTPLSKSCLPDFIESLKIEESFSFHQVCMKDSRSINNEDLKKVTSVINKSKSKYIIITHGTYTMPDTARYLENNLKTKTKTKTKILTGAMIPLVGFSPSDAPFNLGYTLASIKILKPGIYVCMNGRIFTPQEVVKRISEGKFVSVFNKN